MAKDRTPEIRSPANMAEPRKDDAIKSVQVEALVSLVFLSLRLTTYPLVPVTDMVPGRDDGCERPAPPLSLLSSSLRRHGTAPRQDDEQPC